MRRAQPDPVPPELAAYVIRRDGGCVVGRLGSVIAAELRPDQRPCRTEDRAVVSATDIRGLTVAHIRDRGKGGRTGKRPPSVPRHLAAVCHGHHLADPVCDLRVVRDVIDGYLEELEGPDQEGRPWERIPRVRGAHDGA